MMTWNSNGNSFFSSPLMGLYLPSFLSLHCAITTWWCVVCFVLLCYIHRGCAIRWVRVGDAIACFFIITTEPWAVSPVVIVIIAHATAFVGLYNHWHLLMLISPVWLKKVTIVSVLLLFPTLISYISLLFVFYSRKRICDCGRVYREELEKRGQLLGSLFSCSGLDGSLSCDASWCYLRGEKNFYCLFHTFMLFFLKSVSISWSIVSIIILSYIMWCIDVSDIVQSNNNMSVTVKERKRKKFSFSIFPLFCSWALQDYYFW